VTRDPERSSVTGECHGSPIRPDGARRHGARWHGREPSEADVAVQDGRIAAAGREAEGYRATIVGGEVTYRGGAFTGALPGRLVRGARPGPG